MIFVAAAATAAAAEAGLSTPGLTPSSNVTDFFCSIPVRLVEFELLVEFVSDAVPK